MQKVKKGKKGGGGGNSLPRAPVIVPSQRYLFSHIGAQQWDKPWRSIITSRINKRNIRNKTLNFRISGTKGVLYTVLVGQ